MSRCSRRRATAGIAASVCVALLLVSDPGARAAESHAAALPARVATRHTIAAGDHRLDYEAIAETLPLSNAKGEQTASIWTIAYVVDGAASKARPVSFVFNGGPGAASVFLHLGALGPRVLETPANGAAPDPPVRLIDNPSTWLSFTDLVFVDPVGTGFSRGFGKEDNPDRQFWNVSADLASLGGVVRLWLTRHQRWNAPVYLVGESYGGFRAAALAQALPRDADVTVSGLVLISPALDLSALHPGARDLLASAFFLPSYATIAAVWRPAPPGDDIAAVERFALTGYLTGLAGLKGRPPAGDPFIRRVADMTGLGEDIVRRYRGRVPAPVFVREIRRTEGELVSRYDGTIARPAPGDEDHDEAGDPLLRPAAAAFGAAFNIYSAEALGYRTEERYRVLDPDVSREWDWRGAYRQGRSGWPMTALEAALLEHPNTRVLIVNGRDDLVTPYLASRWLVDQLELPDPVRAQVRLRVYAGGHMMYMHPDSRAALARDAAALYAPVDAVPHAQ